LNIRAHRLPSLTKPRLVTACLALQMFEGVAWKFLDQSVLILRRPSATSNPMKYAWHLFAKSQHAYTMVRRAIPFLFTCLFFFILSGVHSFQWMKSSRATISCSQ
jgi:hypothetical protein